MCSDYKSDEKFVYDTSELTDDTRWIHEILMSDRWYFIN